MRDSSDISTKNKANIPTISATNQYFKENNNNLVKRNDLEV